MNPTKEEVEKLLTLIDIDYYGNKISENVWRLVHSYFDVLVK